jgi:hypothetical protein
LSQCVRRSGCPLGLTLDVESAGQRRGAAPRRQTGVNSRLNTSFGKREFTTCSNRCPRGTIFAMKQQIGFYLQLAMLALLPMLCYWQLQFGFRLIWMPGLLLVGVVLFWLGTRLRES